MFFFSLKKDKVVGNMALILLYKKHLETNILNIRTVYSLVGLALPTTIFAVSRAERWLNAAKTTFAKQRLGWVVGHPMSTERIGL